MGGIRKELACLSLLLLMLLGLETCSCFADGNIHKKFKGGSDDISHDKMNSLKKPHKDFMRGNIVNPNKDGDGGGGDVFGAEKRKVYTGPNPLHNR